MAPTLELSGSITLPVSGTVCCAVYRKVLAIIFTSIVEREIY
ncbi:MAG: hypothetical protein WHU95_04215 [candidate division WOR-3 bacterium]|nr:hypothetical protein [candidate division WOR-3 bacterium]MDH7518883.1 hypothetical protein [bacterium]